MAKPKLTPQMIRQIQRASQEEKLPPTETGENIPEGYGNSPEPGQNRQTELQQLKIKKEAFAKKRIGEIEEQIRGLSYQRQEEMRKRRQEIMEQQQKQKGEQEKSQLNQPLEISSKSKRGAPFWGKRIKTAQQQSQPETAGRRIAG